MIEIRVPWSGDVAYADTPEAALLAARTLREDARETGCQAPHPCVVFTVDGVLIERTTKEI